jgi:hypothetical protein
MTAPRGFRIVPSDTRRTASDEKWQLAREMIRRGYSAARIAELVDLPVPMVRIVKQAGDW